MSKGYTLIELLLVIVIIGASVFLIASLPNALGLVTLSRHLSLAREIATKQIEDKRAISYGNLTSDNPADPPVISDSRLSLLPKSNGTTLVEDCNLSLCPNGEHIKQVTVTISWKENNKSQTLKLKTLIGEGGVNQ